MNLPPLERESALWKRIAAELEGRLASLRMSNDNDNLDGAATARVRGRIAEVKQILAWADDAPLTVTVADES